MVIVTNFKQKICCSFLFKNEHVSFHIQLVTSLFLATAIPTVQSSCLLQNYSDKPSCGLNNIIVT